MFKLIAILFSSLLLFGCAQAPRSNATNPFTSGQVSLTLKKGVTTKAEVAKTFGAPNVVTQNAHGSVWIYQKNAQVSNQHSEGTLATILLISGGNQSSSSSQSSRTMTLIIHFNKKDIVSSFKSMTTSF